MAETGKEHREDTRSDTGACSQGDLSWFTDRDSTSEFQRRVLNELKEGETPPNQHTGNPAAEFRLRKKRAKAINAELSKHGQLAVLAGGSLLECSLNGTVAPLTRHSRRRPTLEGSDVYSRLSVKAKSHIIRGLPSHDYKRLEFGFQAFGHMVCLAVIDTNNIVLVESLSHLKVWCVEHTSVNPKVNLDLILDYLKWLCKCSQAYLLRAPLPEEPPLPEGADIPVYNGNVCPFIGELDVMNDFIQTGVVRKHEAPLRTLNMVSQLANGPRSLPYPSKRQSVESIVKTMETIQSKPDIDPTTIKRYRKGLNILQSRAGMPRNKRTHCSLTGTGSVELSRSKGGRGRVLVLQARKAADLVIRDEHVSMVSKYDQFGNTIIDPLVWALFKRSDQSKFVRKLTLGDILFCNVQDFTFMRQSAMRGTVVVPKRLGDLLNNAASIFMLTIGHYDGAYNTDFNVLQFEEARTKFHLTGPIKVKAEVSLEAGMKTRLITCASVGFAHISSLTCNHLKDHLSKDPFTRVGFEESEKFWEVLKQYKKRHDDALPTL